jgi:RNA polymerase sigma-70 factor (ECF subfamily)
MSVPKPVPPGARTAAATIRATEASDAGGNVTREDMIAHLPTLRAFALSLCRDAALADDLVQDTLVKAWSKFHLFVPGTNLRAWLFTILRNTYFSNRRKRAREVEDVDGILAGKLTSKPDHDGHLAMAELTAALAQLPDEQREALILVGAMGFSVEEAAETCGCAPGTIKSRANRGRRALAVLLKLDDTETTNLPDDRSEAVLSGRPGQFG